MCTNIKHSEAQAIIQTKNNERERGKAYTAEEEERYGWQKRQIDEVNKRGMKKKYLIYRCKQENM